MPGVRVRFAPSPTGFFHVGSARTALFNWFVARQDPDGVFLLRIEDTDLERNKEEWVDGIIAAMHWLGLDPDEGPFRQTDNARHHENALSQLHGAEYLYFCDCTADDVTARKGDNKTPGYDGFCRERLLNRGERTALRFRTPHTGSTVVHDEIRGDVEFENSALEDFVVARSSGAVLFGLANVVDDRLDRITHVVRGEEHLPNTPKQILLWQALNELNDTKVDIPTYAHLPVLVNEQRKKLSKRRDPVAVEMYRDQGFLPEAFVNFLSLLGWSPRGDQEIVSPQQSIEQFQLRDVSHSSAFFDVKKFTHINGLYIRELSLDEFVDRCAPWVTPWTASWRALQEPPWTHEQFNATLFDKAARLAQERVAVLSDIVAMVDFLFLGEAPMDDAAFDKSIRHGDKSRDVLRNAHDRFSTVEWTAVALHECVQLIGDELDMVLRKTQAPIRCAVTGRLVGLPLFESLELLGRETTRARLDTALSKASS